MEIAFWMMVGNWCVMAIALAISFRTNDKLMKANKSLIESNYNLIEVVEVLKNQNQYLKMKADFFDKIMQEQKQQTISLNELRKN